MAPLLQAVSMFMKGLTVGRTRRRREANEDPPLAPRRPVQYALHMF